LHQPFTRQSVVPDLVSRQQAPAGVGPFLNAFPVPNGPAVGPGLAQFNASYSNPSSLDAYSIRLDHAVTAKIHLFGRYNYSPSSLDQRAAPFTTPALSAVAALDSSVHTLTIGLTELITPAINNEVRLNYSNRDLPLDTLWITLVELCPFPIRSCSRPASRRQIARFCCSSAAWASTARAKEGPTSNAR
jgi:hypothetical protein